LLQKVLVDFGADESFGSAVKKVHEHYGVMVATNTTRLDVEKHGKSVGVLMEKYSATSQHKETSDIISEMDGSMIPTVKQKQLSGMPLDKRKNKAYEWKEARLALARSKGSVSPLYAVTLGSVDEAGNQLAKVVKMAGDSANTKIHCIGDGAPWISEQVERVFGSKATFLLDFYHASQYLAEASNCCSPDSNKQWFHEQQALLKESKAQSVLENLQKHFDEPCISQDKCPARKCYNYLSKRLSQLNYKSAIDARLPIGSGEIESGHRSVVQKRLKIPGAWWSIENSKKMLSLRVLRANGQWEKYWDDLHAGGGVQAFG